MEQLMTRPNIAQLQADYDEALAASKGAEIASALADKRARQAKESLENALWEGRHAAPFPGH
jgi:hypothetical protein